MKNVYSRSFESAPPPRNISTTSISSKNLYFLIKSWHTSDMKHHKNKKAFTLAEVLITLGIIGVVVALTLPNLIANYKKKSTVEQLKVAYSTLSQAVEASKKDHEDISNWDFSLGTDAFVKEYLAPYLKLTNVGAYHAPSIPGHNYFFYYLGTNTYDLTNQSVVLHSTAKAYIYSLPNGMLVTIAVYKSHTFNIGTCVMRIDINGTAKPNMLGKDVFAFTFTDSYPKLTPGIANQFAHYKYSTEDLLKSSTTGGCNIEANANWGAAPGDACSAVIIKDGWKIRKEYPW